MPSASATWYALMARTSGRMRSSGFTWSASFHPEFGGALVGSQPLAVGQRGGDAAELDRRLLRHGDDAGALLEVVYAKRRREARGARGRQHVVRAGAVITQRLRAPVAEEDGACVSDP